LWHWWNSLYFYKAMWVLVLHHVLYDWVCVCVCVFLCVMVCGFMYVCVCVCVCVCLDVYGTERYTWMIAYSMHTHMRGKCICAWVNVFEIYLSVDKFLFTACPFNRLINFTHTLLNYFTTQKTNSILYSYYFSRHCLVEISLIR